MEPLTITFRVSVTIFGIVIGFGTFIHSWQVQFVSGGREEIKCNMPTEVEARWSVIKHVIAHGDNGTTRELSIQKSTYPQHTP